MILRRQLILPRVSTLLTLISVAAFGIGCGDGSPDSLAEAAEEINSSESGLVKIAERAGGHVVVKYLTPEYLANAEERGRSRKGSPYFDSLVNAYRKTMSFRVLLIEERGLENKATANTKELKNLYEKAESDFGWSQEMFQLESVDTIWYPLLVQPESAIGSDEQAWFVVFPVDPYSDLKDQQSVSIVYTGMNGTGRSTRLTFRSKDLIP